MIRPVFEALWQQSKTAAILSVLASLVMGVWFLVAFDAEIKSNALSREIADWERNMTLQSIIDGTR